MSEFTGFTPDAPQFLLDLHFHNDREWFTEHKTAFETLLKKPCLSLAEALVPVAREMNPAFDPRPERAVARIYRDARYAKGSPYKDYMLVHFRPTGLSAGESMSVYFYISYRDWGFGFGCYNELREMMDGFRNRLETQPGVFLSLVNRPGMEIFTIDGQTFKRFAVPEALPEKLRHWYTLRNFYCDSTFPTDDPRLFDRDALLALLTDKLRLLAPVYRFVADID